MSLQFVHRSLVFSVEFQPHDRLICSGGFKNVSPLPPPRWERGEGRVYSRHEGMVLTQEEIDGCRDAFLAFDKDRSGNIDVWELRQVMDACVNARAVEKS